MSRGPTWTERKRLPLVWVRSVSFSRALARDAHDAGALVKVGPADGERFRDSRAGPDEELGEWAVVLEAGVEVALDLVRAQVVDLRAVDRELGHVAAGGFGSGAGGGQLRRASSRGRCGRC